MKVFFYWNFNCSFLCWWVFCMHLCLHTTYLVATLSRRQIWIFKSCIYRQLCDLICLLSTLEGQQESLTAEPSLQFLKWKFTLLIWNFTNRTQFLSSQIGHAHFISQQIFIIILFIKLHIFISIKVKNIFKGICEIMTIIAIEVLTWSKKAKCINTLHTSI